MIINIGFFFFSLNFTVLGNVNRFYVFRNEILNNLPKVKINYDDLYIHIRGGDIFKNNPNIYPYYAQPPLCYYKNILNKFIFRKVIIISEDVLNPVIPILLKEYSFIKYNKNNIKLDISYLIYSNNIITFLLGIIKLNRNLKFLWEYDFYIFPERYIHLHYSAYTFSFNYTIYKMYPSDNYRKLMIPFYYSERQRNQMINEKCDINFHFILPRFS